MEVPPIHIREVPPPQQWAASVILKSEGAKPADTEGPLLDDLWVVPLERDVSNFARQYFWANLINTLQFCSQD